MAQKEKNSDNYIPKLEEKIIDLSLKLKSKSNELNAAIETNSKILGKLTHNLKNPVGVIFSFSEMILEDLEDYSTEKLGKHMQIIKNSATFSLVFLDAISKYTRVNSPNYSLKTERLNYSELVNGVVNDFKVNAFEKNIGLEVNVTSNNIFLTLDKDEITQALSAVLNNALRYSNENSTVIITVEETKNWVETTITDQGIGISETDLPYIFEEFYVINTYSDDKQKCIGLGLAIAKKIIEKHKGKISASSILDKGSSFKITLPNS
ncbi:MAG: HAMP domain-containing histidine kinase [Lutibacter sp.]|nr:HAMP domain-containing histidine kinase [Lutibacter sp.]